MNFFFSDVKEEENEKKEEEEDDEEDVDPLEAYMQGIQQELRKHRPLQSKLGVSKKGKTHERCEEHLVNNISYFAQSVIFV